jgi:hypothetical protein
VIPVSFVISSAFNWHISHYTAQSNCHLSFKYEKNFLSTAVNFAVVCRRKAAGDGYFAVDATLAHFIHFSHGVIPFFLLLLKSSVSHAQEIITVIFINTLPAAVFVHILNFSILHKGAGRGLV